MRVSYCACPGRFSTPLILKIGLFGEDCSLLLRGLHSHLLGPVAVVAAASVQIHSPPPRGSTAAEEPGREGK